MFRSLTQLLTVVCEWISSLVKELISVRSFTEGKLLILQKDVPCQCFTIIYIMFFALRGQERRIKLYFIIIIISSSCNMISLNWLTKKQYVVLCCYIVVFVVFVKTTVENKLFVVRWIKSYEALFLLVLTTSQTKKTVTKLTASFQDWSQIRTTAHWFQIVSAKQHLIHK